MAKIERIGFGQVEPNHLSAQRTGQIYAQLPAKKDIEVLENEQFVKYDYAKNEVNFDGEGEFMLVFNEVKLYDDNWRASYKDFAMKREDSYDKIMTPRVFKTNIGDIYTTNCVNPESEIEVGSKLIVGEKGILEVSEEDADMVWQVAKVYTLADGQPAVKIQRIK